MRAMASASAATASRMIFSILVTSNYRGKISAALASGPDARRTIARRGADRHPGAEPRIGGCRQPANHADDTLAHVGIEVAQQLLLLFDEILGDALVQSPAA